ncbi:hypothetical protein TorRG33x02_271600 [Trema orientale]|uniref:Uncharacterized protein n=1 Tax=Trema orientale TaxID=63057 RepID=A0A2P5CVM8_TREOI|nr:hypothetical protein TorRG33x02_271600 [Trema orientale]
MDYVIDSMQRIEAAYVKLFEDIRNVEGEIVTFRKEFRYSEEDRRSFHKAVLSAVLCRSKSGRHFAFYGEEDVQMNVEAKEVSMPPNLELRIEDDDEIGGKRPLKSSNKLLRDFYELDSVYIRKPFIGKDAVSSSSQFNIRTYTPSDGSQAKPEKVAGVIQGGSTWWKEKRGPGTTMKQGSSHKLVGVTKIGPFTFVNALQYHKEVTVVYSVFNEDLQGE